MSFSDPVRGERLANALFEPSGDGYVYFPAIWSSGYPVTSAERQEYIQNFSSAYASYFRAEACSRSPVRPPRLDGFWKQLDALSPEASNAAATLAIPTALWALQTPNLALKGLLAAGAIVELAIGLKVVIRRLQASRGRSS